MTIDRRSLIGAGLGLTIASATAAEAWPQASPAAGATDRPNWPPEHFALWPKGKIPGARATLPTPNDTMNGPPGHRQLWLRGVADPIVWIAAAEGDNQLHGFDLATGKVLFNGGGTGMSGLHHFGTLIAANRHLYVVGDNTVYAFTF